MEVIKEIKNTEGIAEEKIKMAQQQGKDIILQAEEQAEKLVNEAVNNEISKGRLTVAAAEKEAIKEAGIKTQLNQQISDQLKQSAQVKMQQAVKLVMERIVSLHGHS
jgi:V/A-type H+/Na+-transporting ATPase subunit G/H